MLIKANLLDKFSCILPKLDSESDIYFDHFLMDGLEEMHQYSKDERLYEFFEFEPFKEIEDTKAYIEKLLNRMSNDTIDQKAMYWFVRRKSDDYLIGSAALVNMNYDRQSIEWGYGINPTLWGYGYVLQIQEALKKFTFEVLELNRLHGVTMVENDRTIQSVLASGMRHEGILRDFYCKQGVYHDGWQYGMISKDYYDAQSKDKQLIESKITKDDIVRVISSVLTEEEVDIHTSMKNTLSWDSLNHMAIIIELKNSLSIEFNPSEIANATSVEKIYNKTHES